MTNGNRVEIRNGFCFKWVRMMDAKSIFLLFFLSIVQTTSFAQEGIDTAMVRQFRIKEAKVYVKLPILPNKTLDDSCLLEVYHWDTLQRLVYEKTDNHCYGWGEPTERFHTYNNKNLVVETRQVTPAQTIHMRFEYNAFHDIVKSIQTGSAADDTFFVFNKYMYDKKGRIIKLTSIQVYGTDSNFTLTKYAYDDAGNLKESLSYNKDNQLIEKQTFDITPVSKKLLEFSTETKLPKPSFLKGWNYYNIDAQKIRTQYSNNTWVDFTYGENGLPDKSYFYNMEGKLNSLKSYYFRFH